MVLTLRLWGSVALFLFSNGNLDVGAIACNCNGLEIYSRIELYKKWNRHIHHILQHTHLRSVGGLLAPNSWEEELGMPHLSFPFLASPAPNPLPYLADLPQGLSWSGRSRYKRNSVGRPSGLRWLSYMPQSDSTKHNEKYNGTEICPFCLIDIKLENIQPLQALIKSHPAVKHFPLLAWKTTP